MCLGPRGFSSVGSTRVDICLHDSGYRGLRSKAFWDCESSCSIIISKSNQKHSRTLNLICYFQIE